MKWVNTISAYPTKWSNTHKQSVGNLPTNCLNMFDYFCGLALKELNELDLWWKYENDELFLWNG